MFPNDTQNLKTFLIEIKSFPKISFGFFTAPGIKEIKKFILGVNAGLSMP
jgi:hypothetical protein